MGGRRVVRGCRSVTRRDRAVQEALRFMEDDRVRAALQLLQEARRMDIVCKGVVEHLCPTRRAASGVAAAVSSCSPPRKEHETTGASPGQQLLTVIPETVSGQQRPQGARSCGVATAIFVGLHDVSSQALALQIYHSPGLQHSEMSTNQGSRHVHGPTATAGKPQTE
ncbi:hypothetical protein NDU88_006280 [Pleurodeles waltl]|uniref:Uncharacterized protein n=1 Tax=Pleurodeles waltl TaxID=8319 RepID=A0AAV7WX65_PLEWA|nr:hypothetical protein NDU88_006280 [Pleurodeles waltl]